MTDWRYVDPMRQIRVRLPELLEQRRINRKQLAQVTGLRYATLSDVYSGKRQPTLETLELVLNGVEQLSGRPVDLSEVLDTVEVPSEGADDLPGADLSDLRRALAVVEGETSPEVLDAWHAAFEDQGASVTAEFSRGAVVLLDLTPGSERARVPLRPCVMLSDRAAVQVSGVRALHFIVPLTPASSPNGPLAPPLRAKPGHFPADSKALVMYACSVNAARIVRPWGTLDATDTARLQAAVRALIED